MARKKKKIIKQNIPTGSIVKIVKDKTGNYLQLIGRTGYVEQAYKEYRQNGDKYIEYIVVLKNGRVAAEEDELKIIDN